MLRVTLIKGHLAYGVMLDQILYCMKECAQKNDCNTCEHAPRCRKSYDVLVSRLYSGKELTRLSS